MFTKQIKEWAENNRFEAEMERRYEEVEAWDKFLLEFAGV
jgi:hypothetical protein